MLWTLIAAMTVAALALLLPPLLRRSKGVRDRAAFDMEVYRDQIEEVGRDLERGLITGSEAEDARTEIGRRLLAADRQMSGEQPGDGEDAAPSVPGAFPWAGAAAGGLAVAVPAVAVAIYFVIGSPELVGRAPPTGSGTAASGHTVGRNADMAAMVDALGARLRKAPGDSQGWALYARSLMGLGRLKEAVAAFRRAAALNPRDAALLSLYGESMVMDAGSMVTPEAKRIFDSVLAMEPRDAKAQYYLGVAALQAGRRRVALERWLALERTAPPGTKWGVMLSGRIEKLAGELGIGRAELAAERSRTASPPAAGAQDAMVQTMVARLAARLGENSGDVEGWRRLARSYQVLGETIKARAALKRLSALVPDDVKVLSDYATAIANTRSRGRPLPAELVRVVAGILKRQPDHQGALWYAGLARAQAGDGDGAKIHWRRLQKLLTPGTRQHQTVSQRIEQLVKETAP